MRPAYCSQTPTACAQVDATDSVLVGTKPFIRFTMSLWPRPEAPMPGAQFNDLMDQVGQGLQKEH